MAQPRYLTLLNFSVADFLALVDFLENNDPKSKVIELISPQPEVVKAAITLSDRKDQRSRVALLPNCSEVTINLKSTDSCKTLEAFMHFVSRVGAKS